MRFTKEELGRAIIKSAIEELNKGKEKRHRLQLPDIWVPDWHATVMFGSISVTVTTNLLEKR